MQEVAGPPPNPGNPSLLPSPQERNSGHVCAYTCVHQWGFVGLSSVCGWPSALFWGHLHRGQSANGRSRYRGVLGQVWKAG